MKFEYQEVVRSRKLRINTDKLACIHSQLAVIMLTNKTFLLIIKARSFGACKKVSSFSIYYYI